MGRWGGAQEPLKSFSTKLVTWSTLSSQYFLFYSFRCMQPCRAQGGFYLSYVSVLIPSVDAGLMHFLEKQEKHRLVVLFSSYFSIKASDTDPRFLHWEWTGIPGSQLEKPEEKQDQSLLQFVTDGLQVQCLAVAMAGGSLAQNSSCLFKDPKGWSLWHKGKRENTVADVILGGEQVAWGFPACPRWLCGTRNKGTKQGTKARSRSLPHQCMSCSLPISLLCSLFLPARWATSRDGG